MLTIAYHNLGAEKEYLRNVSDLLSFDNQSLFVQYQEALHNFQMAMEFAQTYLGPDDEVTVNFSDRYHRARQEITPKLNKAKELAERKSQNKQ